MSTNKNKRHSPPDRRSVRKKARGSERLKEELATTRLASDLRAPSTPVEMGEMYVQIMHELKDEEERYKRPPWP